MSAATTKTRPSASAINDFGRALRTRLSKATGFLAKMGKSLIFPIAALPIAAILLRIGNALPSGGSEFSDTIKLIIENSGNFMFANLPIIFATGVAFGLAKDNRGEAALVGLLGMLLLTVLMSSNTVDLVNRIYSRIDIGLAANGIESATGFHRVFDVLNNPAIQRTEYLSIGETSVVPNSLTGALEYFINGQNTHLVNNVMVAYTAEDLQAYVAQITSANNSWISTVATTNGATTGQLFYLNPSADATLFANARFVNNVRSSYNNILANNVLSGFIVGAIVAYLYNKFDGVELPNVLGFFSGRRLIPVLAILTIMLFGILYAVIFPWIGYALYLFSDALASATQNQFGKAAIMGVYGVFNRLLIPFGLHHIPNTLFWFTLDSGIKDPAGSPLYGDIAAFAQGAALGNTAGTFQSGFFPIMMFGLPALVGAFWYTADNKAQRRNVISLFGSAALISFLTGITEPIEFAFLFVAPALFAMHVLLTGLFSFITGLFGIQIGFGFSAGLLDYGISLPKSLAIIDANYTGARAIFANPGWIWPIGLVTAASYFFIGKLIIKRFNIATPGRGKNQIVAEQLTSGSASAAAQLVNPAPSASATSRAAAYVAALGGYENITNFQSCTTRLRYDVQDSDLVDVEALTKAGARGAIKISKTHVQVIIGFDAEKISNEIIASQPAKAN